MSNVDKFLDMQSLLGAQMEEIDDLPPVGVPPSGHYDFSLTVTLEDNKAKTGQYFKWAYEVTGINEVANAEEASEVKVGTKFMDPLSPFKKTGEPSDYGIGKLKMLAAPFAAHFGESVLGEVLQKIKEVQISAELVRRADRNDPEQFRFDLKNVVIK